MVAMSGLLLVRLGSTPSRTAALPELHETADENESTDLLPIGRRRPEIAKIAAAHQFEERK